MTDRGRARPVNQDSAIARTFEHARESWTLLVVADGLGGGVDGDIASDMATRILADDASAESWSDPSTVLHSAVRRANDEIFALGMGATLGPARVVGTTVVAALIHHATGRYWTLNVGDSRAYLYSDGKLRQLSEDHSLVGERLRAGEITADEARVAKDRNVVTRAVGTEPSVDADVIERPALQPGEAVLLCSDGLHGMLSDVEISEVLKVERLEMLPPMLVRAANEAGGTDNIAVAVAGAVAVAVAVIGLPSAADRKTATPDVKRPAAGGGEPRNGHGLVAVFGLALLVGAIAATAALWQI